MLTNTHTHTHTHGHFSGTTRVSRYQKGKTNLDFTAARDSEWKWHPLGHMQVCTSLQTDNNASTPPLSFLQAGCPSCHPTNSIKALKALHINFMLTKLTNKLFSHISRRWHNITQHKIFVYMTTDRLELNNTHTRLTARFSGTTRWAGTRKVKPIWTLLKQETVSGSGTS